MQHALTHDFAGRGGGGDDGDPNAALDAATAGLNSGGRVSYSYDGEWRHR